MVKSIACVQEFTANGTGNVTVLTGDLRGLKPKGAIIVTSLHGTGSDGLASIQAGLSIGFTDGTNSRVHAAFSEDNLSDTDVYRDQNTTGVLLLLNGTGGTAVAATLSSFISGGCVLNFGTYSFGGLTIRGFIIFFAGDDVSCFCGTQALGTGTSALDVTAPGFQPDVVFNAHTNGANASAVENFFGLSLGMVIRDGSDTQAYVSWAESDAVAAGGPSQIISTLYGLGQQNAGAATEAYHLTFGSFDASGFSVTPSASAGSDDLNYFAVKLGTSLALVDISTPTSTGNVGYTSPGFTPQCVLTVATNLESRDTSQYNVQLAGGLGICAFTANEAWGSAGRISALADPTDTANETNAFALIAPNGAATLTGVNASFVSMDANGFTLNYSQVEAAGKMAFALAIGKGDDVSLRPAAWHHRRDQGICA